MACLQDIHLDKSQEKTFRSEWGGEAILATKSSNSRGVAILISNNFEFTIHDKHLDPEGNYIILDVTFMGVPRCTLVNLYGPNKDSPAFYEKIKAHIESIDNSEILLCGDWNSVRDYNRDTYKYIRQNNPKIKATIDNMIKTFDLTDVWRSLHPDKYGYTWWTKNPTKKARLDFFLATPAMFSIVKTCKIGTRYRSDHAPIKLELFTEDPPWDQDTGS